VDFSGSRRKKESKCRKKTAGENSATPVLKARHYCCSAECLLLAHSGHHHRAERCPLLGVKRTWVQGANQNWVTSWILELEDVFRLQTVIRLCRPLQRTALLERQPCAHQFFDNCPIRVPGRIIVELREARQQPTFGRLIVNAPPKPNQVSVFARPMQSSRSVIGLIDRLPRTRPSDDLLSLIEV
jgi:hypothetical protein